MGDFEIKKTGPKEDGLFATKHFIANQVILKFKGKQVKLSDINELANTFTDRSTNSLLQVGPDLFLNLEGDHSYFINHSCNPNCYVKIIMNNAFLISIKPINPGEELFFDYSLTSTETQDTWLMKCNCHLYYCRKEISGFNSLSNSDKQRYILERYVPKYVI